MILLWSICWKRTIELERENKEYEYKNLLRMANLLLPHVDIDKDRFIAAVVSWTPEYSRQFHYGVCEIKYCKIQKKTVPLISVSSNFGHELF